MGKWPSSSGKVSDLCTNTSDMPMDFEGEDEPMIIEGVNESMVIEGENMPCSLKSVITSVSETLFASKRVLTGVSPDFCVYHVTDTIITGTPTETDTPYVINATSFFNDTHCIQKALLK